LNTGAILVFAAFGATGAALAAYLMAWSGQRAAVRLGRAFHVAATALLAAACVLLLVAILADDFSVTYVAGHSSRQMPVLYKISAFWAGQEGTILLWALLQALVGFAFLARRDDWEPAAMSFLLVPQSFFLLLLVKLQPFASSPAPPEGSGLNPLLLDPWMAIHPPIVFIGYAALAAPFALSLAALALKRDESWVPRVMPWVLISALTLGLGLFIGGFWAYKVLGWGGYWGWDPVENSSLAPWIVAAALVHGLLMQKATGALRRTNLALGALAYVLAIYSTYLTRSGVLADFSVHSFADGGINAFLMAMLAVMTLLPAGLLTWRWKTITPPAIRWDLSLSPMMPLAVVVLMAGTALLVMGTSWPIISTMAGSPASPGPGFYNQVSLPIGVGIAALLSVAPLMGWAPVLKQALGRQVLAGAAAGFLAAAVPLLFGLWPKGGFLVLLLLALSVAALVASLIRLVRQAARHLAGTGAAISHTGLALMLIGIVTTSAFDRSEPAVLEGERAVSVMGHEMTLLGYKAGLSGAEAHFEVEVAGPGGGRFMAMPIMFKDERRDTMIARPHIERSLLSDVYIAPVSYQPPENPVTPVTLVKGQALEWGDTRITFISFKPHEQGGEGFSVAAEVEVQRADQSARTDLLFTAGADGISSPWVDLPLVGGAAARLEGMQVESGRIRVTLRAPRGVAKAAMLSVEVSHKPLVNALWLGIVILSAGTAIAARLRFSEARALAGLPSPQALRRSVPASVPPGMVAIASRAAPKA